MNMGKFKIEVQFFFVVFCDKKNAAGLFGTAKVAKVIRNDVI